MAIDDIERYFPALKDGKGWKKTSEETENYNCFAWAAGISDKRLDPTDWPDCDWPDGISNNYDLSSFIELFGLFGFEPCATRNLEIGYVKIALYQDKSTGEAMHAARQLPDGRWSSKIGDYEDISHDELESLEGYYGSLVSFMRKKSDRA